MQNNQSLNLGLAALLGGVAGYLVGKQTGAKTTKGGANSGTINTIAIFAKVPLKGKSKTRLIPRYGEDGALALARAMLGDLLTRLASTPAFDNFRLALVYAPADEQGRAHLSSFLKDLDPSLTKRWELIPMESSKAVGDHLRSYDLGDKLKQALNNCKKQNGQTIKSHVIFLGMDTPDIGTNAILNAFRDMEAGYASVCPASDGGCTLIGVPDHCPGTVFDSVKWSTYDNCISMMNSFGRHETVTRVGETFVDIDESSDCEDLFMRLKKGDEGQETCPRVLEALTRFA